MSIDTTATEPVQIIYDVRPLYRVNKDLAYKTEVIRRGSLHRLEKIDEEGIERLLARGTITEVSPPPLAVLPGWTRRAELLDPAGIVDAVQFIGAHMGQVASLIGVKVETAERWRHEVLCWLAAPIEERRR